MSLFEMESSARLRSSSRCRRFRPISTFLIVDYWNTVRRALPESFLIGRFSSTLLSEVLYRARYFPLQPTSTLVPIDFEVNSCLTSVFLSQKNESKEKNGTKSPRIGRHQFLFEFEFILSRVNTLWRPILESLG